MLIVNRSNRADLLARLLAARLRLDPPGPFEQVQVVVNTWPTSRWLGEQLAEHLGGIAANLRFPFPGGHLRQLVDQLLPQDCGPADHPSGTDPWRADRLVWPLLTVLPTVAEGPDGGPLRQWLAQRECSRGLESGGWQLGRSIADCFDDYALYRPEMLRAWEAGKAVDGRSQPLPNPQLWQPRLYRQLRRQLGCDPFALRVQRLIERLRQGLLPAAELTPPLRLFGLSSMAPIQVELLQALSGYQSVEIYLLTPCEDLWRRCTERRRQLSDALALREPLDADWLMAAPGLEARFGRLGGEFQQLLEGTGDTQFAEVRTQDLFFAPAQAEQQAREQRGEATGSARLLVQLQEQLADPSRISGLVLDPDDNSLEFHACPGRFRQVQIVRDRLLQLLAADATLEPRDILVMTPDIDGFAPLVASAFGDGAATGVSLPWRLTDRSQEIAAGMGRTLLGLLEMAGARITASALEDLLSCLPLQRQFGLDPGETAQLAGVLQDAGFRWGLDGHDRGGDACHSLSWAIDRLLLGLVLPATPGLAPDDTAPFSSGASLDVAGRWLHLLGRLRHWLGELRRGGDAPTWGRRLGALLEDLFGDGGDSAWELASLLACIDAWLDAARDCPLEMEAPVVAAVLREALGAESGRFGHRSGALTISALEPMRAIPHRVIVLMGLDADSFPRHHDRPAFHLMERHRQLGDPDTADQDRYVLMEALLSARDHLVLCWCCRDDRTGAELPPSGPVRQWQQWLVGQLGLEAAQRLTVEHPANSLDVRNFQSQDERPPASCDRRLLACVRRLAHDPPLPSLGLAQGASPVGPAKPAAAADPFHDLRSWLMAPQKEWLRALGLRPAEWERPVEDLEALELEERDRAALLRQRLERRDGSPATGEEHPGDAADWRRMSRGQGLLPPLAAGWIEAEALQRRWSSLKASLASLGPAHQAPLAWDGWMATPLQHGDTVVVVHIATARARHRLDLWLQLLVAAAAAPGSGSAPKRGVLISREKNSIVPSLELLAPDTAAARAELERLASLREAWRASCWPVPPETGWAYVHRERQRPGHGLETAGRVWEGQVGSRGERDQGEMVVCFGADLPAAELLSQEILSLAVDLFTPLLEAIPVKTSKPR